MPPHRAGHAADLTARAVLLQCSAVNSATRRRFALLAALLVAVWGLLWSALRIAVEGPGVLGVNNSTPWGWDVVQFVFWIGLGHAGTLLSAVLLLTGQRWRVGIARQAELMTLCAVVTAAVFPLVHVGRIWMLWLLSPLPVESEVWPNMASPLFWDAAAVGSYLLLSLLFLLVGVMGESPALQGERRASWARASLLLAGVLTPLVVTVHSVVGSDFAVTLRWHAPWLPAYFVCGALLSGLALVVLIALLRRAASGVVERLALLLAGLSGAMGLFYALELVEEPQLFSPVYAAMLGLNVLLPSLCWWPRLRRCRLLPALVSSGVLVGMWLERAELIIFRPLAVLGGSYAPSSVDVAMLLGSVGLFVSLFLLISARLPEERHDPLTAEPPAAAARPGQGCWALAGAAAGVVSALLWAQLTQGADTAGSPGSRPAAWLFCLPPIFVAGLLGAGLAVFINLLCRLRRS